MQRPQNYTLDADLGKVIKRLRTTKGFSIELMAERSGNTVQRIKNLEAGKAKRICLDELERLALALDTIPFFLMYFASKESE